MITSSFVSCSSFYISRLLLLQISRTLFNIIWKEDFHHKFYLFTGFTQTPPTPGPKSAYLSLTKAFCRYSLNYFDSFLSDFAKVLGYVSKLWDRNPTEQSTSIKNENKIFLLWVDYIRFLITRLSRLECFLKKVNQSKILRKEKYTAI